jgi:hypothetical protein
MNRNGICNRSLNVSPITRSKRIFVGSHIHELMNDRYFDTVVPKSEKTAWEAVKQVPDNFMGNPIAPIYGRLRKCFNQRE